MDCSLPGSPIHGISQARVLEWVNVYIIHVLYIHVGFPGGASGKESAYSAVGPGFDPWRKEWIPTPAFLPGEFHGQRNLTGYNPWGHKELDTTE